ncbi:uridine diphosphate glucose pyrophosphatase NUDT22 [Strongylocentrotus purpuratus]|uniref:Nudix hydrolase domain-containing protein n=1 Tax=Strongylocentrotus purpuratus TaxID=7668 RepID=A0A7M7PW80_STRPU|nr:uridine diphosphate glucose pyrophosphatase NUDT22 [Strongylocentrotus purpuratus]XP_030855435.1 uridine diphosphate glucose pyrophosphatase NUDT22 [Strongylocentrotus purpuratus]
MDSEVTLLFTAKSPPGIPKQLVHVVLNQNYNRTILPEHEEHVEDIWQQRLAKNQHLYNGSKFRYHSIQENPADGGATFHLGLTDYREFQTTNWAPNAEELRQLGSKDMGQSQAYMSDPLGVGSFVLTADGFVVFIRRSSTVGEAVGLWDIPGGHPEPKEVKGGSSKLNDMTITNLDPAEVVDEIFQSTLNEIRDEINIPLERLSEPVLMGVALNHTSSGRPSSEYFVRCDLPAKEVKRLYQLGGAEANESSSLKLVSIKDIPSLPSSPMWAEMCPSGKGCVLLYNSLMPDR